jgi:hypothetical protein
MHPELRPCKGQRSPMLMYAAYPFTLQDDGTPDPKFPSHWGGGVHAFITEGTLRSVEQIDAALTGYADWKEQQCERRRIPADWQFKIQDVWELGKNFGLAGPPPPPTPEELAAKEEQVRLKREADAAREKQIQERLEAERVAFENSPEGQRLQRVKDVIEKIVVSLDIKYHPKLGTKEKQDSDVRWIRAFQIKAYEPLVDSFTKKTTFTAETLAQKWQDSEKDYLELTESLPEELVMEMTSSTEQFAYREILDDHNEKGTWEPYTLYGEPRRELQEGEVRLTFKTHPDLVSHMRTHPETWWDAEKATVWMDDDRSFVMDYIPSKGAEISGKADTGVPVEC